MGGAGRSTSALMGIVCGQEKWPLYRLSRQVAVDQGFLEHCGE